MNHLARFFVLTSFFVSISLGCTANELLKYGTPYIQHYTKKEYKAGNKNWSITQDRHGFIYVGNSNGLLQFDGIRWKKFSLPGSTIIRSVFADSHRIYSGSLGEFGYWEKDENFDLHYNSLSETIPNYEFGDEEIWWIVKFKGDIYFQTFSTTFVYDGNKVDKILSDIGVIFPPFVVNERLYIQALNRGMYEIRDKRCIFLSGSELLINKRVKMMSEFSDHSTVLIGTEDAGLFTFSNGRFDAWQALANTTLSQDQINRGLKISDDLFAIGTILGGVYIMNEEGVILNQINKEKGLNNNTVLSLLLDAKNNLWVGLDNGIDLIKTNSPLYYNTDISGNIGSVYTSAIFKGNLYLGTNRGVFHKKIDQFTPMGNNNFNFIRGSQGQVWNLSVIDHTLFCGHNSVTYIIENNRLKKVSNISGGYDFKQYPFNDSYVIQGAYNGLFVYKKKGDSWVFSHPIAGFPKLSRIVEFERENILWVSHPYRGLFRVELSADLTEVVDLRSFSENSKTYVNKLNNKLVFSSDSGFIYYDDIRDRFFSMEEVNRALGDFSANAHIIPVDNDDYWIFKDGECARAVMDENSVTSFITKGLNDLSGFLIPGHEGIYVMDSSFSLIYLDNGFAIFNKNWMDRAMGNDPDILLRELNFLDINRRAFEVDKKDIEVPYRFNNILFKISYPEYASETDLQYKLEGYEDRWINANYREEINFQNVPFGEYTIRVRPENGSLEEELTVEFAIKPPWYKSATAQVIYLIFSVFLLAMFVYLNKRKIRKIHEKHDLERKRLLEKEATENEKKLIEVRNENLRNEIKLRNSRLAKSTFSLIHKNNTLISVKDELTKIKEELGVRFPAKHFNRIVRNIDKDLTSEKDWKMFEQSFSEVHENFLHKLKNEFSELTPADLQLCAYLKMNLSSKEIASLLNITVRGVEIRRYRLRKKLHLEHDTNLVEFIMGY